MKVANRFLVLAGVLAVVICSSGLEPAAQQQPILGCVIQGTGLLRIPAPGEGCKANETPLGFNDLPLLVALKAQVDALQSALIAERAARQAADTAQQSALAAETAARIAAVNAVVEALCAEVDRLPGTPSDAALALCGPLAKRVFVTEAAVSPNLGGLTGADAQCTSLAQTAGLPGVYKAWLSDETTSAKNRLAHSSIPYARVDGVVVANDFADLTDGSLLAPINITQNGSPVSGGGFTVFVWTGTTADGSTIAGRTCNNWTDATNAFNAASGGPGSTSGSWTNAQNLGCAGFGSDHMYCLQQ
jgi:Protein of unknown function (DUF1554)